jgi:hypothetical protein
MMLDAAAFVVMIAVLLFTGWWRDLDANPEQVAEAGSAGRARSGRASFPRTPQTI